MKTEIPSTPSALSDVAVHRILSALDALAGDGVRVVALDGRSAAGKTTLAALLAAQTGAGVVHMDDFFLPPALRTPERYAQPGGNVHYERFAAEVLPFVRSGKAFSYRRFDCGQMALAGRVEVPAGRLRIVEGAYCFHPHFGAYADLRVFCDIAPAQQLARIEARNGAQAAENFKTRWIPLENRYFEAYSVPAHADLVLTAPPDAAEAR